MRCQPTRRPLARARRDSGFTLIELMIALAIVGIITAIALPNYSEYVKRSKIIEATSALGDMRSRYEQYFLDNRTYVGACARYKDAVQPQAKSFTLSCATGEAASTYTVVATGTGPMAGFVFQIDQSNVRSTTGVPSGWTSSKTCWVVRKNGDCS